eukprot:COSAG02_NODE_37010_length_447_cov_2.100575_1_plen_48_part_01
MRGPSPRREGASSPDVYTTSSWFGCYLIALLGSVGRGEQYSLCRLALV